MNHRYQEIAIQLRNRILGGHYPFGKTIPSEHSLMAEFSASRVTVRRALQDLVDEGIVDRRRRRGTVATLRPPAAPLRFSAHGMLEAALRIGIRTGIKMKAFEFIQAPDAIAASLGVERYSLVQHTIRVRTLDDFPFSRVTTFVPEPIGRRFSHADLKRNPMLVLFEREGIRISRAEQTVKAIAADAETAPDLEVSVGAPLLCMSRVVFDRANRAIQHLSVLYPPMRYEYKMSLLNDIEAD